MEDREILKDLDQRFVDIYEATRSAVVEGQKEIALIVIDDDDLMLYRHDHPMERFTGLRPPRYDKMQTLGHLVLGVYCLVRDQTGEPLSGTRLAQITSYRDAIKAAAGALDTANETATGILPEPSPVYDMVSSFLDAAVNARTRVKRRTQDICRDRRPPYRTRSRCGGACANRCMQYDHGADPGISAHEGRMV